MTALDTDITVFDASGPEPPTLVFNPPTKQTPGYLRRQRAVVAFQQRMQATDDKGNPIVDPALFDDLIAFLLPWVVEPKDRAAATEALLDATEEQYLTLLRAVNSAASQEAAPDAPLSSPTTG